MASRKDCKYFNACGNSTNCARCTGYEKKPKEVRKMKGYNIYKVSKNDHEWVVDGEYGFQTYPLYLDELDVKKLYAQKLEFKPDRYQRAYAWMEAIAKEIKPSGYQSWLYYEPHNYCWMYIVTPNNSLLYLQPSYYGGMEICYEYVPSKDFGTGCQCAEGLSNVGVKELEDAERYGKAFCITSKRTRQSRSPQHYSDAMEALTKTHVYSKLIKL